MKKLNKDQLIKSALKRPIKVKATFTIDEQAYNLFQKECEKQKVPMSRILEAFMKDFAEKD